MSARTKLFKLKKPYDNGESDALFLKAMQENCAFQYENCPEYRKILDTKGFSPKDLKEYKDLEHLPFLPTLYFKHHAVFSMPQRRMLIKATSSGTSGQKSRMGYNFMSLYRGLRMILTLGKHHRMFSLKPVHYLILGYEPNKANKTVISKTSYGFTYFAPALSRDYALRYTKDGYKLDLDNGNSVHEIFAEIADKELVGDDAVKKILIADISSPGAGGACPAVCRSFAIIPGKEGDDADMYTMSGEMKASGEKIFGTVISTDNWQTAVFTPDE